MIVITIIAIIFNWGFDFWQVCRSRLVDWLAFAVAVALGDFRFRAGFRLVVREQIRQMGARSLQDGTVGWQMDSAQAV